jgi:hypothetical protein
MTPDERKMLEDLASKVAQTPPPPKDPEAEEFIRTRIGSRPDALYLMTQTVLIQNLALQHAQEQMQQLQRPGVSQQGSSGGSFLGGARSPSYSQPSSQGSFAPPPSPAPQYVPPPQSGSNPSGAPSFLRGAAQTAAGVAAGALAFEGIQSLFSHPGYGGSGFGGFGGGAPGETVVNNYYDTPQDAGDYRGDDTGQNFADTNDDSGQYDDTGNDFSDAGDGGGFDDSGDNFV